MDTMLRKPSVVKSKLEKQTSNGTDSSNTPFAKRRQIRPAVPAEEPPATIVFGQTANGSSVSYQPRAATAAAPAPVVTPTKASTTNGKGSPKKRERASPKQPSAPSSSDESPAPEFHSASPTVTTKFTTQRKPIVKPLAFNRSATKNDMDGKHDIRTGFLSKSDEQEVLDALEQLRATKTFEEAEQEAKRRFEHILCLNLNRTHVDVPQECEWRVFRTSLIYLFLLHRVLHVFVLASIVDSQQSSMVQGKETIRYAKRHRFPQWPSVVQWSRRFETSARRSVEIISKRTSSSSIIIWEETRVIRGETQVTRKETWNGISNEWESRRRRRRGRRRRRRIDQLTVKAKKSNWRNRANIFLRILSTCT